MTTLPDAPDHLLSLAEWDALPEDNSRRLELVEGAVVVSPRPLNEHQAVAQELAVALDRALRPGWRALTDVEVSLAGTALPTVRAPDVVVLHGTAFRGRSRNDSRNVLAVVEVLSPGSHHRDRLRKLAEYARSGIECYLVVEPGPPTVLTELRLRGEVYESVAEHENKLRLTLDGIDVVIDLAEVLGP